MSRPAILLASLAFLAATAASAQESGGVQAGRFFNPHTGSVAQPGPGCRLSQTNVVVGVNRALGTGARAGQRTASVSGGDGGCRPLVSTGIVAGVNLGLGFGSTAEQTVQGVTPSGSLATNTFSRGVNIAGPAAAARQRVFNLVQP